jgi:N-terminal domain of anti-restriction factor ArdC
MAYKRKLTAEQEAATEARRAKFRELLKAVSAMSDEERVELVDRIGGVITVEGRRLSVYNTCLLLSQRMDVSMVGGYRQWQAAGRQVRKGESGMMIWIPRKPAGDDAPGKDELSDDRVRFIIGTVFDEKQTDEIAVAVAA